MQIKGVCKSFSGNTVLQPFQLDIRPGEFHALIGENGAGKSTLINLLTGVYEPDSGSIVMDGQSYSKMSPANAKKFGIRAVHQELSLQRHLTVTENIFLGDEFLHFGFLRDKKRMRDEAGALLTDMLLEGIEPDADVGSLSLADQQLLEFSKAIYKKPRLLILDEATSALNSEQVALMFTRLKKMKEDGLAILFISHRLHELYELCDIMTVLKDGQQVTTEPVGDFNQDKLVSLMTGRSIIDLFPRKRPYDDIADKPQILNLESVCTRDLNNLSFSVRRGEILGIGGLAGQGQQAVMECLFGISKTTKGNIKLDGKDIKPGRPRGAMKHDFAYLPAERKTQGLFVTHPIRFNLSFARLDSLAGKLGSISRVREDEDNRKSIEKLSIKLRDAGQLVGELSGGNQQKVVIAKWLMRNPKILLLNEPTRGIDVGTKKEIYELLRSLADEDVTIIMVSSDTLELIGICDRVIVMYENEVNSEISSGDLSEESLVHASVFRKEAGK